MENTGNIPPESVPPADLGSVPAPAEPPPAPSRPRRVDDPAACRRIIDALAADSRRGAKRGVKARDGNIYERPVRPRQALQAMRLLNGFRRLALEQRKLDHAIQADAGRTYELKDYVTPVVPLAGERAHEEALRRGLDCAAALPPEDRKAIYAQAEAELQAAGVDTDPHGVYRPQAEPARTWEVPDAVVAAVLARLVDMADPAGAEARTLRERERMMARKVLLLCERTGLAEERFERDVRAGAPVFDRTAALAEMEELVQRRLVERRREAEEFRRRLDAFEAAERSGPGGPPA